MKKVLALFVSLVMFVLSLSACSKTANYTDIPKATNGEVGVVSFNVAAPWGSITDNTLSSKRVKRFASYMNAVKPDFIGTQEMNSKWMNKLSGLMSDYDSYGVKRGGDENEKKSEMNTVFWLKEKYTSLDKGTFWLTETPQNEGKYYGAGCNRVCTYVILKSNETNEIFIHLNTHLDNASEDAASFGAKVIKEKLDELNKEYENAHIILTGDFNENEGMDAYNTIDEVLDNSSVLAKSVTKSGGTYQNWGEEKNEMAIDFIFTNSQDVSEYTILDDISSGYISDHFGVFSSIK